MTARERDPETIELNEAPPLPGLTFRRFRGASDFPHMAAVIDGSKVADGVERSQTPEDMARFYAHLPNCDPYQDMLLVEVAGQVIGYTRVWWQEEAGGTRQYSHLGFLLPAWRRRGIGRAMLRWNEARLRAIAADHPPGGPRFLQAFAADTEVAKEALLRREGYQAVRHGFGMRRSLAEEIHVPPLPAGLEVRPALPEHYRTIWEADQEAFRDHWGYIPGTETEYQAWRNDPNFSPHLWQVAWDVATNQVAGMVQNFINHKENAEYNRQRGYTEGISVRQPWRRRGLAQALIMRSLQMHKDLGMTEAALGVDSENLSGALRLYERCGFRVVKRESIWRKPLAPEA